MIGKSVMAQMATRLGSNRVEGSCGLCGTWAWGVCGYSRLGLGCGLVLVATDAGKLLWSMLGQSVHAAVMQLPSYDQDLEAQA